MQDDYDLLLAELLGRHREQQVGTWPASQRSHADRLAVYEAALLDDPAGEAPLLQSLSAGTKSKPPLAPGTAGPDAPTPIGVSFTYLAQTNQKHVLAERLRPWLPFVLRQVGLDESLAEALLTFIEARLPLPDERRFRDVLPRWVAEFARQQGKTVSPTLVVDRAFVARAAAERYLRRVLDSAPSPTVAELCACGLEHLRAEKSGASEWLLQLTSPKLATHAALASVRQQLYAGVGQVEAEGLMELDCASLI